MDAQQLKEVLAGLRHSRDWSVRQLAAEVGVSPTTISNWERGSAIPNQEHLARLEQIYDLDAGELTSEVEQRPVGRPRVVNNDLEAWARFLSYAGSFAGRVPIAVASERDLVATLQELDKSGITHVELLYCPPMGMVFVFPSGNGGGGDETVADPASDQPAA